MAPSPPLPIPSASQVESLTGSLLIGFFLAWGLFGILSAQVYMYSQVTSRRDRLTLRVLVYTIYAVQIVQIVLFTNQGFQVFAAGFGDFTGLDGVRASWFSAGVLDGFVSCAVQLFYARRIWIISSGRKIPPVLIIVTSVASLIGSIASGVLLKSLGHLSQVFVPQMFIKAGIWEASGALCDVLIAGFTIYYLKRRSPHGPQFKSTSAVINSIIRLSIETGSLTASVAIAAIVVTYLPGHPGYFIAFVSTFSGLYSNSLMVLLNNRIKIDMCAHSTTWKEGELAEVNHHLPIRHAACDYALKKQHPNSFESHEGVVVTVTHESMTAACV